MHKLHPRLLLFATCLGLTFTTSLSAATLADSPAFSLAPKDLQQEANREEGTVASPAVVLVDDEHWTFHADGTIERKQHEIYKVLDSSAVQSWSTIQERWEPWHQQRPLYHARVITPDGTAHELDPTTLVDGPFGSSEPQSYSDVRVVQGPLPAVEVGSIIETEVTENFTPVLGRLAFRGYIAGQVPVRFSRMVAEYPESLPFRYSASLCPDLKESRETRNGIVHLSLAFGAFEPVKETEQLLPFDVPRLPSIVMSTGGSWSDLAKQYGEIVDRQIAGAPVKDLVSSFINHETDRAAIIRKLVRALHTEVRYTGVEFGDAAIVPAKPVETLTRRYGDCKDKAALLVAMLRASGITSYLAVLNAGAGEDISPKHPGMGLFNHAIVYVPGSPDLWIDATAEHMQVGSLPSADEGRLALIISPGTTALSKIPESPSTANIETTAFEYYLPDFGPARVSQSFSGTGEYDNSLRYLGALLDNQEFRQNLEKQTQSEWNTKTALTITHEPVNDFSNPFQMTMDIRDAKSVAVVETGASITIPVLAAVSGLPRYFVTDDSKDSDSIESKKPRTAGFVLPIGFTERISCRIHIPEGFALKKIPDDQTLKLGPATYSAHYELKDQLLRAELTFDTGKRNYTLEEGNTLKKAVLEFIKQPAPVLAFEPRGQVLLDEGRLREGLDAFRALADQHTAEAVNHVRLSRSYLTVGCGQKARDEAELAAKIAPKLAVAWRNLGFVNEYDLIGRKYKPGWSPAAVETALRTAMSLDKDDLSIPTELAESFEYDMAGDRFASRDRVLKAVELFHSMGDDKVERQGSQDMMLNDLASLSDLDELKSKLERFGSSGSRAGYRAFLTAMREGGAKAAADLEASSSVADTKTAARTAGNFLVAAGRYQEAADFAGGLGADPQMVADASNLRKTKHVDEKTLHIDSPEGLALSFMDAELKPSENPDTLERFWSASVPPARLRGYLQRQQRLTLTSDRANNIIPSFAQDFYLSNVKATTEANGDSGFRVRLTFAGSSRSMAVVREGGTLKLLGDSTIPGGIAKQALSDLSKGNSAIARKWLDWLREDIKLRSDDDPLGGPVFPRLWTRGVAASDAQTRYAAASLIYSKESLPILEEAIDSTSDTTTKANYELAYANVCVYVKSWSDCIAPAKSLVATYPGSDSTQQLLAAVYAGAGQFQEAERTLRAATANNPDDLALKRALANTLAIAGRMKEAVQAAKEAVEAPDSTSVDWNLYGWISLVAGQADEQRVHAVERAQGQPNSYILQTIASMYAEIGKINEARQISLQALDRFNYETPDSSWWYVFGRIAEELGVNSAALAYYEKVTPGPDGDGPLSTYALARKHLAVLNRAEYPSSR